MLSKRYLLQYSTFATLVVLMGLFSLHTLTSIYQDIGRHISVGRIIWETGNIPGTNLFSYTNPDFPFVNHHWLGSVALYLGELVFGLGGLIVVKAILITLAFGLSLAAAWRPRLEFPAIVLGLAAMFTMTERTDVRPEVLSFLFLGWFLFVLYRRPSLQALPLQPSKLLWTLPLVQLLWVNTHIYFFMGPLIIVAWLIGEYARTRRSVILAHKYWLLLALMALATCMNPSGLRGALYPLTIWSNYGYSIVENQTLFFLHKFQYPIMTSVALGITVVLTATSFVLNRRNFRRNVDGAILFAASAAFALIMIRNFPLMALIALPVTLRNLDQSDWRWGSRSTMAVALVVLALLGVSIATNQIYSQAGISGRKFGLIVPTGPQEPIEFFRSSGLHGPIFNNFDVGSFLIWKLPEEKVFIDGRPEAYPAHFIQNIYIPMQENADVWKRESARYGINTIFWNYTDITPWSQKFVARITQDPLWKIVYRNKGIVILVRK